MRAILFYLLALAAVVAGVRFGFPEWFGASSGDVEAGSRRSTTPPVVVATARVRPLVDDLAALGTVRANESVLLTPHRADRIVAIHFVDGMEVVAKQPILELKVDEETAELAEAKAVRDEQLAAHKRAEELFERKVESASTLAASKALLDAAEARVQRLEAVIADHTVLAPFSGTLGLRQVSLGAYVQPTTVITTLDDLSVVKVDFTVPETWLNFVREGMSVTARSAAWRGETFNGKIQAVDTRVDETARSVSVRALLSNGDRRLKPGMLLQLSLQQGDAAVLQVPEEAIKSVRDSHFVRRVEDGIARKVEVTLGRRVRGSVAILSGLADGDRVIVEGLESVRDDNPVEIVDQRDPAAEGR